MSSDPTDDLSAPAFTHFEFPDKELPLDYYVAMGRALFRWSQLESTVSILAVSILGRRWPEAMQRFRGGRGFNVKGIFQQLESAVAKKREPQTALRALRMAALLYERRKILFHSVWGYVTGPGRASVGIQEWTAESYDNFRPVPLEEIEAFASECCAASVGIMKSAIPLFHGASAVVFDDGDGMAKGHEA